jgi:hypothetical protein
MTSPQPPPTWSLWWSCNCCTLVFRGPRYKKVWAFNCYYCEFPVLSYYFLYHKNTAILFVYKRFYSKPNVLNISSHTFKTHIMFGSKQYSTIIHRCYCIIGRTISECSVDSNRLVIKNGFAQCLGSIEYFLLKTTNLMNHCSPSLISRPINFFKKGWNKSIFRLRLIGSQLYKSPPICRM